MSSNNLYDLFKMDAELEREGITIDYGSIKFLLARAGGSNTAFKKLFQSKAKKYRHQIDNKTMSDSAAELLMAQSYAEAIILGWWSRKNDDRGEAILDKDGEEQWVDTIEVPTADGKGMKKVKYSVKECVKLLLDLPDLFTDIQSMAGESANYRKELEEEDEGNLEQS